MGVFGGLWTLTCAYSSPRPLKAHPFVNPRLLSYQLYRRAVPSWTQRNCTLLLLPVDFSDSFFLARDAMHKRSLCHRAVSVRLSVTFVYSVEMSKYILKLFSPFGWSTILVFQHQTLYNIPTATPFNFSLPSKLLEKRIAKFQKKIRRHWPHMWHNTIFWQKFSQFAQYM